MVDSSLSCLNQDVGDANPRIRAPVAARLAEPLAALLLEDDDLGAAGLAVDNADNPGVRDERCPGEHLAAVLLEEEHLVERDLLADFGVDAVDGEHRTRIHPDLTPARLNDCEHVQHPPPARASGPILLEPAGTQAPRRQISPKSKRFRVARKGAPRQGEELKTAYLSRTRVPLIFWVLNVPRNVGMTLSINSK